MEFDASLGSIDGYRFSTDWFTQNAAVWSSVLLTFPGISRKFLEIGSFEGRSATWMAEEISKRQPIEIHCVDTWAGSAEHRDIDMSAVEQRFDHNTALAMRRAPHPAKIVKHKGQSADVLAKLLASDGGLFDLIYVDGSHVAMDVLTDAVLAYRLLKIRGVLAFDDLWWGEDYRGWEERRIQHEPKIAIDMFQLIFVTKFKALAVPTNKQLFLVKLG